MALPKVNPLPTPQGFTTKEGGLSTAGYQFLQSLYQGAAAALSGLGVVQASQEAIDVSIEYPQNQDYPIEINAPYGYTITQVDSYCASGSCTATVKIGTTALGGTANSVSTSLQSQPRTSANVVAAGNTTKVTISSNSACNRLRLVLWITRT
ncbi:transporter [Hyphomicrobium sp. ghe19]|uniref:transporter n=1 Tax=Hyphomicrobium sp. ghe19 TaxID=2682968 RepID=UPI001366CB07|nr:hypothetical protein HYPP_01526 [Hyphomicrobium sp. ghe19]